MEDQPSPAAFSPPDPAKVRAELEILIAQLSDEAAAALLRLVRAWVAQAAGWPPD